MLERVPGVFKVEPHSNRKGIDETKIFLIPGKDEGKSLTVDAGLHSRTCLHVMEEALGKPGITYDRPDIFLTHRHHDYCGLASEYTAKGTGLFMNPQEDRHCYGYLYYNYNHDSSKDQFQMLQGVGATEGGTLEIWNMFMEVNQRIRENRRQEFKILGYPYTPVNEGQILSYGDYDLEIVGLKGHTHGQMGLYDRSHRVLLRAGQVIDDIAPTAGIAYPDGHLLGEYFDSLERLKHQYGDCLVLPAHKESIQDMKQVMDRVIFIYLGKVDLIKYILDHGHHRMTIREVACLVYGIDHAPGDQFEFIKLKMIINKTFSRLECLYDEDFVIRTLEDGGYYWKAP